MNDSNPSESAQSAIESDAASRKKRDNVLRLLLWLRPVLGCLVALILGLWILCMMDRTIFPKTNPPTAAQEGVVALPQTEKHPQTLRVWALGVTLAAEVSALALVLFTAVRIAREE